MGKLLDYIAKNSFLMVRAGSIRWMTYSTIKRFFQLSVDRFPFPAVAER